MPVCKYFNFDEFVRLENQPGLEGKVATHHLKLYHLAAKMEKPTIVEFGVDKGRSTCVFLQACEANGGHLYSLDIQDFSDVAQSDAWTFIQQSDQEVDALLTKAPAIKNGIDLLHVDSAHRREHVRSTLMKWFPYIKGGGYITFHDVDPTPYLKGQRKDNPRHEPEAIGISAIIREFFYANEDQLFLEYHFGSTGMGIMYKLSPFGTQPKQAIPIQTRQITITVPGIFWAVRHRLRSFVPR